MSNRNKILTICLIIILVLAGISAYFYFFNKRSAINKVSQINDQEVQKKDLNVDSFSNSDEAIDYSAEVKELTRSSAQRQVIAAIIEKGDVQKCDNASGLIIDGIDYRSVCRNNIFLNRAINNFDSRSCDLLEGISISKQFCRNEVIRQISLLGKDVSLCDQFASDNGLLSGCAAGFWKEQAIKNGDINLCGNEKNAELDCKDVFFMDQLVVKRLDVSCENFSSKLRIGCEQFKKLQIFPNTIPACDRIQNTLFRVVCEERQALAQTPS